MENDKQDYKIVHADKTTQLSNSNSDSSIRKHKVVVDTSTTNPKKVQAVKRKKRCADHSIKMCQPEQIYLGFMVPDILRINLK